VCVCVCFGLLSFWFWFGFGSYSFCFFLVLTHSVFFLVLTHSFSFFWFWYTFRCSGVWFIPSIPTTAEQNRKKRENKKIRRETFLRSQYPVVEEWQPIEDDGHFCLSGKIFNDPRFVDGSPIVTSGLVWIDHLLAKTARSKYVLGTPSVDYMRFREQHALGPISTKRFHYACY
jgi:hypothetical protein